VKSVMEISRMFGVSRTAVYKWILGGLPCKLEKAIGHKTRTIIDPVDVYAYHKSKEQKKEKSEV